MIFIKNTWFVAISIIVLIQSACSDRQLAIVDSKPIDREALVGTWEGAWSWNAVNTSRIIIKNDPTYSVRLINFPIEVNDKVEIFDSVAYLGTPEAYGGSNALAALLTPEKKQN